MYPPPLFQAVNNVSGVGFLADATRNHWLRSANYDRCLACGTKENRLLHAWIASTLSKTTFRLVQVSSVHDHPAPAGGWVGLLRHRFLRKHCAVTFLRVLYCLLCGKFSHFPAVGKVPVFRSRRRFSNQHISTFRQKYESLLTPLQVNHCWLRWFLRWAPKMEGAGGPQSNLDFEI